MTVREDLHGRWCEGLSERRNDDPAPAMSQHVSAALASLRWIEAPGTLVTIPASRGIASYP